LLGLWNLPAHGWWREALDLVRIAPETLATPLPPGTVAGPLCGPGADQLHLPAGRPLAVGTLDHHAAAIGSGAVTHDACCVSLGTVLVCLRGLDRFQPRPDCFMGPGLSAETFTQLACDGNGASVLEWYRRTHAPDLTPEQLELRAATVPPGCDGLTARPCAHRAGGLSGFVNRSPQHEPAHYARAIMESVAESLAGLMTRLFGHALPPRAIAAGGGTRSALWMEILSARLGMTLTPAPHPEAACRGAAMFAAAAAGWQDSVPATASQWSRAAPVRSAMP
jgi:xylulokinase